MLLDDRQDFFRNNFITIEIESLAFQVVLPNLTYFDFANLLHNTKSTNNIFPG